MKIYILILVFIRIYSVGNAQSEQPYMELTTSMNIGENIKLRISADEKDRKGIWVDVNNNGKREDSEGFWSNLDIEKILCYPESVEFLELDEDHNTENTFILGSKVFRIYGKVKNIYCGKNQLTNIDISKNRELKWLDCNQNKLTKLDISQNRELEYISCVGNKLIKLDISKNNKLEALHCKNNQITNLDCSKNSKLRILVCYDNKLTKLDISKNSDLERFNCLRNQLTCIKVNKEQLKNISKYWEKNEKTEYKLNCE